MEDDNTWESILTADMADAAAMDQIWGGGENEGCQGQLRRGELGIQYHTN